MAGFWALLASQPLLTLFLVISLGYAVGDITIAGFRLGVGAVLFIGLLIGAFAPDAAPPAILSSIGLILFFYGIGIQYGTAFVNGLSSAAGRKQNAIALFSTIGAGIAAALCIQLFQIPLDIGAGLFSGALVNTATLESAIQTLGSEQPIVGYGVAYPFGVFGPILCIYLVMGLLRPKLPTAPRRGVQGTELLITQPNVVGRLLSEVTQQLPPDVQVVAVQQDGHNRLPRGNLRLSRGDELLLEGEGESLQQARQLIGEETAAGTLVDIDDLDDVQVYVSRPAVIGRKLGTLNLAEALNCVVIAVERGNSELYPHPGLVLEAGDRLHLAAESGQLEAIEAFFGNSAHSIAEISYLALGLGMVLGVLFGLIPFPLPGLGTFSFGAAGGALIVALFLGWRKRIGPLSWVMPPSANLTLRNFGLTLFLAVAGLRSAEQFVATVRETGIILLGAGAIITLAVVLLAMVLGATLLRLRCDDLLGVVAGVTGNPAILAYASRSVPTNQPELGYAIVFPTSTIIKIIVVQVLLVALA